MGFGRTFDKPFVIILVVPCQSKMGREPLVKFFVEQNNSIVNESSVLYRAIEKKPTVLFRALLSLFEDVEPRVYASVYAPALTIYKCTSHFLSRYKVMLILAPVSCDTFIEDEVHVLWMASMNPSATTFPPSLSVGWVNQTHVETKDDRLDEDQFKYAYGSSVVSCYVDDECQTWE